MRSKKFVIGYAVAIFLIVFLITFNSVCSITQFDVRYDVGSEKAETLSKNVQNRLDGYLRKSFLFFSEQDVYSAVEKEGGGYLEVVSVQKRFPNKITVCFQNAGRLRRPGCGRELYRTQGRRGQQRERQQCRDRRSQYRRG